MLRQRRLVYLAVAILAAAGVWSAFRLPSAIYPRLDFERIVIVAQGTALDAEQIEYAVTRPLEAAVSVVPGVERVRSRSIRGASELSVTFGPGTDMVVAHQLVQARVNQVAGDLPEDVDLEVERMLPSLFPILTYSLEGGDPAELYDVARYEIAPVLSRIRGVGRVDVQGSDVREIEVVATPERLATLGMGYSELADRVRAGIGIDAVGRVTEDYRSYLVVSDQLARSAEDVGDVVVQGVRLRDVASVARGIEDRVRLIYGNGRPAALINISRQQDGNTVTVADSVARAMSTLASSLPLPEGARLVPVYDQAELVRGAVHSVRDAMIMGALLVVVVLLLFLREGRITAIAAASIPLTMAITILILDRLGGTFNLMSLGGMAIAIGLVIDDAVVVTENIARHLQASAGGRAVREAMGELVVPVTTSTLTTIVVFLPLGLLQGVVGQFFAALSIALATAVLVSLLLALTLVPLLCQEILPGREPSGGGEDASVGGLRARWRVLAGSVGEGIDGMTERYGRSLEASLGRPRRVIWIGVALVAAGVLVSRCVGTGFLPIMDEGAFVLDYWTPGGTPLAETDRELLEVERILASTPGVAAEARRTGSEMGLFATGQNTGDIAVRLEPRGDRSRDVFKIIDEARERIETAFPRMRVEFVQVLTDIINDLAGTPDPLEIKLFGDRLDELEAYAGQIAAKIEPIDGVVDLYDGIAEPNPEMRLVVDGGAAERLGLTPAAIGAQVRAALLGERAGEVRSAGRSIAVRVRAPDSVRFDPRRLGEVPVFPPDARTPVPLSALARFEKRSTRSELLRENQREMVAVTAGIEGRSLGGVMGDVRRALGEVPPPPGVRVEVGGQYAGQQEAFHALLLVLALAVLAVIGVMLAEFRSFVEPLVIVLAAPLSFVGAIALLWITGTQLDVSSFMGMILLVGLIVKNGILLLDFTYRRMEESGATLGESLPEAARIRFRPILMTTLATLFGLLPLALGVGAGSELQRPLALAVIGGLALSTPITLYVVPTVLVAIRGRDYAPSRG